MINAVRNTVLAILNKNNYGYISPADFNLFAKQAQLDIFDEYFISYNSQINKENARVSGTGYADIKKGYEEVIDTFSVTGTLANASTNIYTVPTSATTGSDYYLLNKILIYSKVISSGTTTGVSGANALIDSSGTFQTDGVAVGDIVSVIINAANVSNLTVTNITSNTQLEVSPALLNTSPLTYAIYRPSDLKNEAEPVTHSKITMLNKSMLTTPNVTFPAYTLEGNSLTLYPTTVNSVGRVASQYIRYPKDPKWTYISLSGGEPLFDQSQSDFQDFELPEDDVNNLVARILQYAGLSIREISTVQFGQGLEQQETQEQ
mgnify:FL=1|jgi:hypothetical protein